MVVLVTFDLLVAVVLAEVFAAARLAAVICLLVVSLICFVTSGVLTNVLLAKGFGLAVGADKFGFSEPTLDTFGEVNVVDDLIVLCNGKIREIKYL